MKYPNKLQACRLSTPKSQQDLADALKAAGVKGATKQKIWKIERGLQRITPQEIAIFAKALNCNMGDILPNVEYEQVASYAGSKAPPYQRTVNSMTATEEAAEIFKMIVMAPTDVQEKLSRWIRGGALDISDISEASSRRKPENSKKKQK